MREESINRPLQTYRKPLFLRIAQKRNPALASESRVLFLSQFQIGDLKRYESVAARGPARRPSPKRNHLCVGYYCRVPLDHLLSVGTPRFDRLAGPTTSRASCPSCRVSHDPVRECSQISHRWQGKFAAASAKIAGNSSHPLQHQIPGSGCQTMIRSGGLNACPDRKRESRRTCRSVLSAQCLTRPTPGSPSPISPPASPRRPAGSRQSETGA
jgi:hypothetical protein